MNAIEEVVRLRNRVEELEAERKFLKEALRPSDRRFSSLKLTPSERTILHRLYAVAPQAVSNSSLIVALDNEDAGDPLNTLAVFIHKLRKKVSPIGVVIFNDYTVGYYIETSGKKILDGVIAREVEQ